MGGQDGTTQGTIVLGHGLRKHGGKTIIVPVGIVGQKMEHGYRGRRVEGEGGAVMTRDSDGRVTAGALIGEKLWVLDTPEMRWERGLGGGSG